MFNENELKKLSENLKENHQEEVNKIKEDYSKQQEVIKPIINIEDLAKECKGNELLEKLFDDMVEYFFDYTANVCDYEKILLQDISEESTNKELVNLENTRKRLHNAMIDSVNILARNMQKAGKNIEWISSFNKNNRVAYANLAMQNVYLQLIKNLENK